MSEPCSDPACACHGVDEEERADFIQEMVGRNVEKFGRHVFMITGDQPFVYTIGNHLRGMPELLCVGVDSLTQVGIMMNHWSDLQLERGRPFEDGEVVEYTAKYPIKIVTPNLYVVRAFYTCQAGPYLETEDYEVRQIVLADKQGRWPGDPKCSPLFQDQEVRLPSRGNSLH